MKQSNTILKLLVNIPSLPPKNSQTQYTQIQEKTIKLETKFRWAKNRRTTLWRYVYILVIIQERQVMELKISLCVSPSIPTFQGKTLLTMSHLEIQFDIQIHFRTRTS